MYRSFLKRIFDVIISLFAIILALLPMLVIAASIKTESKGNVIFRQERIGKDKRPFTIFKFRTMVTNAYEMGGVTTSELDPRITRVGKFLRRTSLDELPQLLNILRGEMSIIGPRPIIAFEFDDYVANDRYTRRFSVLPGLFCSVDIELRSHASRDIQFELDAEYAENIGLIKDASIFGGVIKSVITCKNVYKE